MSQKFFTFFDRSHVIDVATIGPKVLKVGLALIAATVVLIPTLGLNWGLDFSGGSELQVQFKGEVQSGDIIKVLGEQGFDKRQVQRYGAASQNEWLIRVERLTAVTPEDVKRVEGTIAAAFPDADSKVEFSASEGDRLVVSMKAPPGEDAVQQQATLNEMEATLMKTIEADAGLRLRRTKTVDSGEENTDDAVLRDEPYQGRVKFVVQLQGVSDKLSKALATLGELEVRRVDFVDARVAESLRTDGVLALLLALAGILIYLALRFDVFFAPGALIATLHDPLLALLVVYVIGRFEFETPSIAAMLTVVGYSVNGVIVIYDRIRENLPAGELTLEEARKVVNTSVNQTWARSIITVMTTLMTTIPVAIFTSGAVRTFAVTLSVGFVIGTISALFIAPALYLFFRATFYTPAEVAEGELTREDRERGVV
jgi:preprotein translocase subunit SecF